MPCTRLYVEPTAALMDQARKKKLLGLIKQWWDNMRGHNSFLIIITSKDYTQAFKKSENKHSKSQESGSERNFSALYFIIEVSLRPPWTFPIHPIPPYIQPIPPTSSVPPPSPPPPSFVLGPWWWWILSSPPPSSPTPLLHTSMAVMVWSAESRYLYPTTIMNPVQDMEYSP